MLMHSAQAHSKNHISLIYLTWVRFYKIKDAEMHILGCFYSPIICVRIKNNIVRMA